MIGFSGKVPSGLHWHPNATHIVYPLGTTVVIKSLVDGSQSFLTGHTDTITTVALSACGRFVASGQKSNFGKKVRAAGGRARRRQRPRWLPSSRLCELNPPPPPPNPY